MLSYCLKCRKDAESKNSKIAKMKSGRIMVLSKFAVRNSENWNLSKRKKLEDYYVA